jgi:enediyne polyketide synthase
VGLDGPPWLFLLAAEDSGSLASQARDLAAAASALPKEEDLRELAADRRGPAQSAPVRAAVLAASVAELEEGLEEAAALAGARIAIGRRAAVGAGGRLRIGFLFPGQGAPARTGPGAVGEAIPVAARAFAAAELPAGAPVPDELVQLSVVASCLSGLAVARALEIEAELAIGHSLGELVALYWAEAWDRQALLQIAYARGLAMTAHGNRGTMATLRCGPEEAAELAAAAGVTVACRNSPRSCVVSGEPAAVEALLTAAKRTGLRGMPLPVVGAFHSPLMRPAQPPFADALRGAALWPPRRRVFSTITGGPLGAVDDLKRLLVEQLVEPVLFGAAVAAAASEVDLLLDLGPGRILAPLVREITAVPIASLRVGDAGPKGLLEVAAAAFAAGAAGAARLAPAVAEVAD